MMIYYAAQNKEIEQKVREEIDKYLIGDDFSFDNLKKCTYVDKIQKETTRVYGPVNGLLLREAARDHYLGGIPIPKNTIMNTICTGNHYNPKYFKQPEKFIP